MSIYGRHSVIVIIFAILSMMISTPAVDAQANAQQPRRSTSAFPGNDELLAMIAARVKENRATGIVLGVMDADGSSRIVSYGNAGPQAAPLGPNTVFEIGSITKVLTATVLATMAARNEVVLDAPVRTYLPSELAPPDRNGVAITLANLAEQNSGLPGLPDNFAPKDAANPFSDYTLSDLAAYFKGLSLSRAPGERYEYSNLGVGVLGLALSRRAGTSYEKLVTQRILNPLGMSHTVITLTPAMRALRAIGHDQQGVTTKDWDFSTVFEGAGAFRSNMIDMLKFLDANMGAARNELEDAMRVAHNPRASAGNARIGLNWLTLKTPNGVDVVYHTGNTGGFSSYLGFDPVRGIGVVMLVNQFGVTLDIPVHLLDPKVPLREAPKTPAQLGAIDLPADTLTRFAGTYVLNNPPNLRLAVTIEGNQLFVEAAGVGKLPFYPRTPLNFFTTSMNAEITFVNDAGGKVAGAIVRLGGVDQNGTKVD